MNDDEDISDISFESHINFNELNFLKSQTLNFNTTIDIRSEIFYKQKFLTLIFNNWRKIIKEIKLNEIKLLNYYYNNNKKIIEKFFNNWILKKEQINKLKILGLKIKCYFQFISWKNMIEKKTIHRQLFLKILLIKKKINEKNFFLEWKISFKNLKKI